MKNLNTGKHIVNDHGMLIYSGSGRSCVGYIMDFKERGLYDPDGKLEGVTPEAAKCHNELLDEALIKGLDESCQVGQGGIFYFVDGKVGTFLGVQVSERVSVSGKVVTFWRKGKEFKGRTKKDDQSVFFKRVA